MKRPLALVGTLAATAGIVAGLMATPIASASSHREAPAISKDPSADNTDVYAFVSPDKPDTVTIVANYIPAEQPSGGPNFYEWDPSVLYEIHVHNQGGANDEITYQFRFKTNVVNPDTFLYNVGPISFDPGSRTYVNWNRPQTYSVTRVDEQGHAQQLVANALVPPVNVGIRSTPDYESLAAAAITDLGGGRMSFAGQRDDPFFVDLGSIFDLLGLRPFNSLHKIPEPNSNGVDDVGGLSVHAIVLQVPKSDLTHNHLMPTDPSNPNSIVGIYASASRRSMTVLNDLASLDGNLTSSPSQLVQVSRLGEPLINEVLIPMGQKDRWNRKDPHDDSTFANFYLNPEPARLINALYDEPPVQHIDESGRSDLTTILLTGVRGLNFTGGRQMDLLRLNMAIPPSAAVGAGDPLGVLKGDLAGFPNGRRLEDDVTDIEVRAIAQGYGAFLNTNFGLPDKSPNNNLGDADNQNDKAFLTSFPYLASPKSGYDPALHVPGQSAPEPLS